MARLTKKGRWLMQERRRCKLIAAAQKAYDEELLIRQHPIVFPSLEMRDYMFYLGAQRNQVDCGFDTKETMEAFLKQLEAEEGRFAAQHGLDVKVPHGLLTELVSSWTPSGAGLPTREKQLAHVEKYGGGATASYLLDLMDYYNIPAKRLQRMTYYHAEIHWAQLKAEARLDNWPPLLISGRHAECLARRRLQPDVQARIGAARDRRTMAVAELVTFSASG